MERFNNTVRNMMDALRLNNEYVSTALIVFLVAYASMAAPRLPQSVANLFEKTWFRFLVFFAIAYLAKQNATVAVVAALAVLVTLQTVNRYAVNRDLQHVVENYNSKQSVRDNRKGSSSQPAPTDLQQDEADYRNNFYPSYVEEPVEHMRREENDEVTGYSEDTLYANFDEE
uniref:Uncharacterized protein n=1 Tax=viral metagenome TaxID=1070528 RepID=A0A6C0ACG8_9ZZZZ